MASIEVLGENMAEKLAEVRKQQQQQRRARLKLDGTIQADIIKQTKEHLNANPPELEFEYMLDTGDGKRVYNVALAKTTVPIEIKEFKYGPGVRMVIGDDKIMAFRVKPEQIDLLKPDAHYIIVGHKTLKPWEHGTNINFNVHAIISMDEVKAAQEEKKTEQQEIAEKVQEHTQPEPVPVESKSVEEDTSVVDGAADGGVRSAFDPVESKDVAPVGANI